MTTEPLEAPDTDFCEHGVLAGVGCSECVELDRAVVGQAMALLNAAAGIIYEAVKLNQHPTIPTLRPPLTDVEQVHPPFLLSRREQYRLMGAVTECRSVASRMQEFLAGAGLSH